jgi:PPM family protein phosphatase
VVVGGKVFGASAGDSGAWLIGATAVQDLTEHQRQKPLLGSGNAVPIGFGPVRHEGRLLMASDGLFKYVPYARICDLARSVALADAPTELVAAARLSSGTLQDDVAVLVAG